MSALTAFFVAVVGGVAAFVAVWLIGPADEHDPHAEPHGDFPKVPPC